MAGLHEARDRIQPATRNIVAPSAEPSLSAANVIYIINPRNGETVAPWDMTNKYADTELCQEKVLELTGTFGIPCTTIASGSSWYSVVDNSQVSSAPWNLSNGITYDHCWAENLIEDIFFDPPPSTKPLKVLSTRTIP